MPINYLAFINLNFLVTLLWLKYFDHLATQNGTTVSHKPYGFKANPMSNPGGNCEPSVKAESGADCS